MFNRKKKKKKTSCCSSKLEKCKNSGLNNSKLRCERSLPNTGKKFKKGRREKIITAFFVAAFIAGFCIYAYPYVSSTWNSYADSQLMAEFESRAAASPEKSKRLLDNADAYNRDLVRSSSAIIRKQEKDKNYESQLKGESGAMMGFISIPKIRINVPIFHYSSDSSLEKGIGHIYGSSLPVGGKSTHSLLSGHRGMPSAKMFTDLDRIKVGDKFYIRTYGRHLAYQVCRIKTVLPDEVQELKIKKGKDLVTLVTCTPYGINSHRLIVTGKSCRYDPKENKNTGSSISAMRQYITVPNIICGILLAVFIATLKANGRKKD